MVVMCVCVCMLLHCIQVVVQIQGNLAGASVRAADFTYKYLLIPTLTHWKNVTRPPQYTVGIS